MDLGFIGAIRAGSSSVVRTKWKRKPPIYESIGVLLVLFGIGIIDSCLDGLYFYVPLLLIKIDYILLLFLFVIVVGLIPSISAIVKSITKKPIKVINSED